MLSRRLAQPALPVIATADNGAMEQIADGVSGLFVPFGNPAVVAEQMRSLIKSPSHRRALGAALREKVETSYCVDAVLPQWEKLLNGVLRERRASGPTGLFQSFLQRRFRMFDPSAKVERGSDPRPSSST